MLNWIIQILHYYCSLQHKNIENSRIVEQNVAVSLSLLFSLLTATCASFTFLNGRVFSVLGHSFERHKWSFVLYIVSFSALKIAFSKLSLAKYHCLDKKPCIFHVFNYYRTLLQISLFYSLFCTNLSQVVLRQFLTRNDLYNAICMTLIWLISSYKSEKIELIRSFKNRIIHISMQKVATISQFIRSD